MATPRPHKTVSTHRSAIARGAHQLDIVGYSTWRKLGADNTVRSRSFDAGGFAWVLVCRFTGNPTPARGVTLASIALELLTNETDEAVVAAANIRIDDPTGSGRWPAAEWRSAKAHTFPARSTSAVAWELAVPDAFVEHEERYAGPALRGGSRGGRPGPPTSKGPLPGTLRKVAHDQEFVVRPFFFRSQ